MRISLEEEPVAFSRNGTVYWICEKIFYAVTIVKLVKDCKGKFTVLFFSVIQYRHFSKFSIGIRHSEKSYV